MEFKLYYKRIINYKSSISKELETGVEPNWFDTMAKHVFIGPCYYFESFYNVLENYTIIKNTTILGVSRMF